MADFRLADVVKELRIQNSLSEQTNRDILSLTKKFADLLLQQSIDKQQELIDRQKAAETALEAGKKSKEAVRDRQNSAGGFGSSLPSGLIDGFLKGSGLGWLGNLVGGVFSNIFKIGGAALGLLTGGIGFAAGKLLKWGFFGGLIVNYFSDEITNWLDPDGDGKMQFMGMEWDANDAKFWGGLSIAAGFIATSLISFVGSSIIGLGSLGLAALFMKIPGLKDIGLAMDAWARAKTPFMQPKGPPTAAPVLGTPPVAEPPIITPATAKATAELRVQQYLRQGKVLPPNWKITPTGKPMFNIAEPGGAPKWRFSSLAKLADQLPPPTATPAPAEIKTPSILSKIMPVLKWAGIAGGAYSAVEGLQDEQFKQEDIGGINRMAGGVARGVLGMADLPSAVKNWWNGDGFNADQQYDGETMSQRFTDAFVATQGKDAPDKSAGFWLGNFFISAPPLYNMLEQKIRDSLGVGRRGESVFDTLARQDRIEKNKAEEAALADRITQGAMSPFLDTISKRPGYDDYPNMQPPLAPTTSNSIINNQQFESFYFGGGTSMDVYDATGLKLSWR
jgi:hypothetical protein